MAVTEKARDMPPLKVGTKKEKIYIYIFEHTEGATIP